LAFVLLSALVAKMFTRMRKLPTLSFPQSSISVNDLRHPHRHLGLPLQALERAVLPGKDARHQTPGFYVRHFETVELNNSFYRLPPASASDQAGHAAANALTLNSMVFGTRVRKVA
jgi:hypothetical protein